MPGADRGNPAHGSWARLALLLLGGAVLLYVTFAATFAQVMGQRSPALAQTLWPMSAAASARMAEADLATMSTNGISHAASVKERAARALLHDPVNVIAARVAGLTSTLMGDGAHGTRLLAYAEHLSRRDLGTQVALIETAVAHGDIGTALRHYDTALRTGDNADQLLLPILVQASRDPAIAARLEQILVKQPPWRLRFVYSLITAQPWAVTFVPLIRSARLNVNNAVERDFLSRAVTGLVATGSLGDAVALYAQATGTSPIGGIRNGSFANEDRIPPFDWNVTDEIGLGGVKGAIDGIALPSALSLTAAPGRTGPVARQLLMLQPGAYRLRFVVGNVTDADRSDVTLSCNGTDRPVMNVRFPKTVPNRRRGVEVQVTIPDACPGQWLTVQAGTDIDTPRGADGPWISQMKIGR